MNNLVDLFSNSADPFGNLADLFSNPASTAAAAAVLAYLLTTAVRQWLAVPPIPVAVGIAGFVFVAARVLNAEQQAVVIDLLGVLFATLAAMGVSLSVEKIGVRRARRLGAKTTPTLPWWRAW